MNNSDLEFFKSIGVKFDEKDDMGNRYITFCCEQAILISETLRNKEKIEAFYKADWDEQKKMVPGISDDHSGNTFTQACKLAIHYIPMLRDKRIDDILS